MADKIIYKFDLQKTDIQHFQMPDDVEFLDIQIQGDYICLWALIDPNSPSSKKEIHMYGTGHAVAHSIKNYIGTVQSYGFVWHFFEGPPNF